MTVWTPDTCDCQIEFDSELVVMKVHRKCAKHASTPDDAAHFDTVLTHNRKKNTVQNAITGHIGGRPTSLHVGYDDNDDLVISGHGLEAPEQATVQNAVAAQLGSSKLKWK